MPELNDGKPRRINGTRPYSFFLEEDTTNFGTYKSGGIVTQVKLPKVIQFKPLREAIKDPGEFLLSDFSKMDRSALLHSAFQALDQFRAEFNRFPMAGTMEDMERIVEFVRCVNGEVREADGKVLNIFSNGSRAVLNPMAALFGGVVGQEVVKACSGKFHPIFQVIFYLKKTSYGDSFCYFLVLEMTFGIIILQITTPYIEILHPGFHLFVILCG
jgi:ubiquitin-activating enzyme E1